MSKFSAYPAATSLASAYVPVLQGGANKLAPTTLFNPQGVSVMDYGAAANGLADDTGPIQAAIDAMELAGGGTVYLPPATCVVGDLTINSQAVSLIGTGGGYVFGGTWRGSVLKAKAGTSTLLTVAPLSNATQAISGVRVENVALDGNSIASRGLVVQSSANCTFRGIHTKGFSTACIETGIVDPAFAGLNYVYSCTFENLWLFGTDNCKGLVLSGDPGSPGGNRTAFCSFRHLHVTHKNETGIELNDADSNSFFSVGFSRLAGGSGVGVDLIGDQADPDDVCHSNHFFYLWPGPGGVRADGPQSIRNIIHSLNTEDGPIPVTITNGAQLSYSRDDGVWFPGSYAVADLPTGAVGGTAFATNGRKNGEGAASGTGVMVFHDGIAWRACDTGATVAA